MTEQELIEKLREEIVQADVAQYPRNTQEKFVVQKLLPIIRAHVEEAVAAERERRSTEREDRLIETARVVGG